MTLAAAVVFGVVALIAANVHGANDVIQKVDGHFAIVATGEATLQLQDGMIGFRWRRECFFSIAFEDTDRVMTLLSTSILGTEMYLNNAFVDFGTAKFLDVFLAANGSVYLKNQLHKRSLPPLEMDEGNRLRLSVKKLKEKCVIPIVKGTLVDETDSQSASGGLPVWAIVLIVIVVLAFLVGVVLLAVFHRRLPCFKRKPVTVPEDLAEVKVDPKIPEKKPVPKTPSKPSKLPSESVPPPPTSAQPPPSLPPTPSVSAPPTATETAPTTPPATPAVAALPPPVEPLAPPSVMTPPPPSVAPPTSTITAPRFTAKGSRVHPSVPQHLVDNPTPTKSRSSERKRRKLRKNSLEEGNRPPGYRPAPPPPPPTPKVPSPPTEQPVPSAETDEGKKRCCPEKDATALSATATPTPAFRPTKKLSAKEYLNFTLSEGSNQGKKEGTSKEEDEQKKCGSRETTKKKSQSTTKRTKSGDGKETTKKSERISTEDKKKVNFTNDKNAGKIVN